jgi:hypothetical protein
MYYNLEYLKPLGFKHSKYHSKTIHARLNVQIGMLFLDLFDENGALDDFQGGNLRKTMPW